MTRKRRIPKTSDYFSLIEFSAKWDPVPTMLTQNHTALVKGFMGQTTSFTRSQIKANVLVMGENYNIFSKDQIMRGFQATVQTDFRWTKSHIKSISLLGNVLLKNHANDNNFYETLLIRDDLLTEGAASNVFIVEGSNVITPKLSENLLPGVTRDLIINLARQSDKQVFEEDISSDRLISADEIWCSSSTNYVVPITKVDEVNIKNGKVGDTTKEFYNLVTKFIQDL